jgi:hypothetical protein
LHGSDTTRNIRAVFPSVSLQRKKNKKVNFTIDSKKQKHQRQRYRAAPAIATCITRNTPRAIAALASLFTLFPCIFQSNFKREKFLKIKTKVGDPPVNG